MLQVDRIGPDTPAIDPHRLIMVAITGAALLIAGMVFLNSIARKTVSAGEHGVFRTVMCE